MLPVDKKKKKKKATKMKMLQNGVANFLKPKRKAKAPPEIT